MNEKKDNTKKEYFKRINKVINYIEQNLDSELNLKDLSKKALFSSFHFHRIFTAVVGETLNSFIIRKRIERIASVLAVGSDESLIDLALKYGFSNASSFSRSFRKFYGVSPTEFKETGKTNFSKIGKGQITYGQYLSSINNILKWINMNAQIEIKELPEINLAGIMHIGEPDKIIRTYEKLFKWATSNEISKSFNFKALTIYHDNPRITDLKKLRQSACVTVDGEYTPEGEIVKIVIQKGKYAVGRFEIKPGSFQKAWNRMCVWVIENGHKFRDGDYFEVYNNDYRNHPEQKFIVDICIPVDAGKGKKSEDEIHTKSLNEYKEDYKQQIEIGDIQKAYKGILDFMKKLRTYFLRTYPAGYFIGSVYSGDMTITYFPFTPEVLKEQKLKIAIVFNHQEMRFEIWLAGQNKLIQKKYWEMFMDSDWNKYHITDNIDKSFSIVDNILVDNPDFDDKDSLREKIEAGAMEFIDEIKEVLK